ncbi:MAG: Do family serine endopeptidase [Alphaproteobacteria bacterium]|nr:Do family serine endopeptidase [Alphaproteobacteria bacterium]
MGEMRKALLSAMVIVLACGIGPGSFADSRAVPKSRSQITLSFAPVVKQVAPAVVNIFARKSVRQRHVSPFFNDPFFRRFFGDESPFFGVPRQRIERALGSGVLIRADGIIVTNHHVVDGADEITAVLSDRREFDARLVGSDERTDLAVLAIDTAGEAMPFLDPSDSDDVEVGDLVIAVGNPFGVGQTVTSGIISALARTNVGITDFQSFIQTDAAINPGNSGGALVTVDGRLIGINSAIFTRGGGSIGIGFAIPSDMVVAVVRDILSGGKVARPWLGAWGQEVTAEIASSMGLHRPVGVMVNKLHPAGPAAMAGIEVGDIIQTVDGREVADNESLEYRIATANIGDTVKFTGIFGVGRDQLSAVLIAPPEIPARDTAILEGRHPLDGATVANFSPALAEEVGFEDAFAEGVIILDVKGRTQAARLGFRRGDFVVSVAGRSVDDVRGLRRLISKPQRTWKISIKRGGQVISVVVQG